MALEVGWQGTHVTADQLVKTGPGVLHSIIVNGLTTDGLVTIRDAVAAGAGTIIGILNLATTGSKAIAPVTLNYDIKFSTGLFIDYDATAVADLTVAHD